MQQVGRATLQDVADRAGVSLTTASRVVNEGSRRVGPGLAQRVNQAVAELGYTANLQARAVATGQSTGVRTSPWGVCKTPVRARPCSAFTSNRTAVNLIHRRRPEPHL